ncbi:unnamed protein product [Ectocarpus sp. 6 AP-2014]
MTMTLDIAALTLNMCYESCVHEGSSYFATQDGSRCWCSLESHFDYSAGGVGVCDTWCGGDGSTTCGGSDGLSRDFYKIETGEATLGVSAAGDGVSSSGDPLDRLLELHNAARCMHATGPLEFAEPVAATAKTYADLLASESMCGSAEAAHSTGLGENVFVCAASSSFSGDRAPTAACFSPESAMEAFYDSQVGGGPTSTYGPYATQVLWKSTTQIGCALRACEKDGLTYDILVCRYSPPAKEDTTESEVALEANSKTTCGYD